jgi:hypothetical protein
MCTWTEYDELTMRKEFNVQEAHALGIEVMVRMEAFTVVDIRPNRSLGMS